MPATMCVLWPNAIRSVYTSYCIADGSLMHSSGSYSMNRISSNEQNFVEQNLLNKIAFRE